MTRELKDKIAGALYGFAIGDAMGATTEFMSEDRIKIELGKVENIVGGGAFNWEPGEVTDDTQMALCVMQSLMAESSNKINFLKEVTQRFIWWYNTKPKDIGNQCRRGINVLKLGGRIDEDNNALGNGSLMRALPCALIDNLSFNISQGLLTHNNEMCSEAIVEYHTAIQNHLMNKYTIDESKALKEPTGFVINTLNNAIYWSQKETIEEAIVGAVNHGGDADTIAALTGGLAGARFGYNAIPRRWINQLDPDVKEKLNVFIEYLVEMM